MKDNSIEYRCLSKVIDQVMIKINGCIFEKIFSKGFVQKPNERALRFSKNIASVFKIPLCLRD